MYNIHSCIHIFWFSFLFFLIKVKVFFPLILQHWDWQQSFMWLCAGQKNQFSFGSLKHKKLFSFIFAVSFPSISKPQVVQSPLFLLSLSYFYQQMMLPSTLFTTWCVPKYFHVPVPLFKLDSIYPIIDEENRQNCNWIEKAIFSLGDLCISGTCS